MKPCPQFFIMAGLAAAFSGWAPAEEPVMLRQVWEPGKVYRQRLEMQQTTKIPLPEGGQEVDMAMLYEMSMSVRGNQEEKTITGRYDRVAAEMRMGDTKLTYDSDKGEPVKGNPMAEAMAQIAGAEFTYVVDAQNRFLRFEDFDRFLETVAQGSADGGQMARQMFNEEQMKRLVEQSTLMGLPDRPVSAGDTWPFSLDFPLEGAGKMLVKGSYTLKGFEELNGVRCAVIGLLAEIGGEFQAAVEGGENPANLQMKLSASDVKGTVHWDNALGAARSSVMDTTLKLETTIPGAAGPVEMEIRQKVSVKLAGVDDAGE
ncbi:MAG TPA: DUF6263 family protein [Verrucomicrobiales bacterium]|nr:DUF6263 family protein [Verrucomicrobiales bacterium]